MTVRIAPAFVLAAVLALVVPSVASADFAHTVLPGESLDSIAEADGMSVSALAAENGLAPDTTIFVGQTVMVPPVDSSTGSSSSGVSPESSSSGSSTSSSAAGGGDTSGSGSGNDYVVQPGDTLSAIAANAGMSVSDLAAINGLEVNGVLRSGVVISLGGGGSGSSDSSGSSSSSASASGSDSSASSASSASSGSSGSSGSSSAGGPPDPTPETVTASEVGSIANANGVPASLAEAIGWQESGFNNDIVSSADARGVMQILPSTWDWIQQNLTPNDPLGPASASENVRGGVLLLHSLLDSTGGDPSMAAAAYYQGLGSVQQNGLFNDTQNYVDNVMALRHRFGGP